MTFDKKSKPPCTATWFLRRMSLYNGNHSSLGDFEETFSRVVQQKGFYRASFWYWTQVLQSLPGYLKLHFILGIQMLKNHIKIAIRNLRKHKSYSFINILGLSVGLICCIFILLYVLYEISYDSYHMDAERIFIVGSESESEKGRGMFVANMAMTIPMLKERFPQVAYGARVNVGRIVQVNYKENVFKEQRLWHADSEIFNILKISFIEGDPVTALRRPHTVVITQRMAIKYFFRKILM